MKRFKNSLGSQVLDSTVEQILNQCMINIRRKNRLDEELGHQLYNQLWYDLDYQNNKKLSCNLQDTLRDKLSTQLWDHIRRPFWRIWSIRSEEAHEK